MTSRLKKFILRTAQRLGLSEPPPAPQNGPTQEDFEAFRDAMSSNKIYLGRVMGALQGAPDRQGYFLPTLNQLARLKSGPFEILEIGSWAGGSAISWAEALKQTGRAGRVTCIDTWHPYINLTNDQNQIYEVMDRAAHDNGILALFLHNIRASSVGDIIQYRQASSGSLLDLFAPQSFDLIYIDGDHRYSAVANDIRLAKILIRNPGIICGDDLELQRDAVDRASHSEAVSAEVDFVRSARARRYYHPGVTEAVGESFSRVGAWNGFWAAVNSREEWRALDIDQTEFALPDHIARALARQGSRG